MTSSHVGAILRHTSYALLAAWALCLTGCLGDGFPGGGEPDAGRDTGPPPEDYTRIEFTCGVASTPAPAPFSQLDMLWVIDDSAGMCREQASVRAHAIQAITPLLDAGVDLHLAVTTTGEEGHIRTSPQPLPGRYDDVCTGRFDSSNRRFADLTQLRSTLDAAVKCMEVPDSSLLDVTDDQINCAHPRSRHDDCVQEVGGVDRNDDGDYTLEDVFPLPSEYRAIPKVLRTRDYRVDGSVDLGRLADDFACISLVGTAGSVRERGLHAAVTAASRTVSGGAINSSQASESAPNHGFLRAESAFSVVFVSNENDCSDDGALDARGRDSCGQDACGYENAAELRGEHSDLTSVCDLADRLRANLSDSKGRGVSDAEILVASIHGGWALFERPIPYCSGSDGPRPALPSACVNGGGVEVYSGDRYARFMRQFPNYFPNAVTGGDPDARADFVNFKEEGVLCSGDVPSAMRGIGESFATLAAP